MAINFDYWLKRTKTGCLVWTYKLDRGGYGQYSKRRKDGSKVNGAHVWAWERVNGRVPVGKELHHTCLNRACCDVAHMQTLTHAAHKALHAGLRDRWGCGHAKKPGDRFCRECYNDYQREYQREWRKTHPRRRPPAAPSHALSPA